MKFKPKQKRFCLSVTYEVTGRLNFKVHKINIPIFYDHIEFFFPNDCFFAHNIYHCSSQTMLRIWDTFLYEGSKVLFRFAIAIFKYNEEALLSKDNSIAIFNHLRTMCQEATDVNKLVEVSQW